MKVSVKISMKFSVFQAREISWNFISLHLIGLNKLADS